MPLLSGRYTASNGPLIQIGAEPAWTIARTPGRILQPVPADRVFTALIDSGATMSCISASVVSVLGIKPAGMRQMGSASQSSVATNTYVVDLAVVFPEYLGGSQICWSSSTRQLQTADIRFFLDATYFASVPLLYTLTAIFRWLSERS